MQRMIYVNTIIYALLYVLQYQLKDTHIHVRIYLGIMHMYLNITIVEILLYVSYVGSIVINVVSYVLKFNGIIVRLLLMRIWV